MPDALSLLRTLAETLDSLGIATCVLDDSDRTVLWNRTFLKFFPEHAPHIHVGEPYQDNLRRFYQGRLDAREMPAIERYIDEGVARHHAQQRPYAFEHLGVRLWVAAMPAPGIGRMRIWQSQASPYDLQGPGMLATATAIDGASLFDYMADGVMVTGSDNRILWVNESFVQMYSLPNRQTATGVQFEWVYRAAWQGYDGADLALFDQGLLTLAEHMRFTGAPFELPLPRARWSRVVAQRAADGKGFFAHVDITVLKRQQQQLLVAERRARESEQVLQEKSALMEATLERMDQGVMMVNAQRQVQVCNRRAMELLGLPREMMAAHPTLDDVLAH